jgi:acyl carrier protein
VKPAEEKATSTRATVIAVFQRVAADQGRSLAPLTDELRLVECGLDSLSFAIVVASLEDALGLDPFNANEWVEFPVTLGDLIRLYEPGTA